MNASKSQFSEFDQSLMSSIEKFAPGAVKLGVTGQAWTTIRVGGELGALVTPKDNAQLVAILKFLTSHSQPIRVLGAGSNLVIADNPTKHWVIRLNQGFKELKEVAIGVFKIGAGASLMNLSRDLSQKGLAGLEFAGGIPASIGGAVRMNAGAHGGEMKDVLNKIYGVTFQGQELEIEASTLPWGYRHSGLPEDMIVTAAEMTLSPDDASVIEHKRSGCLAERKKRQPLHLPSAGSVFKNPSPEQPAGKLIEEAGLKGHVSGGAMISEMHANWIVNPERKAKASDIESLVSLCQEKVSSKAKISLEPELKFWR